MQNSYNSVDAIMRWMDNNEKHVWTLYASDGKTILSTNYLEKDPEKSKARLKKELEDLSTYGGTFVLYINDQKGSGGNRGSVILPPLGVMNGMAGINGNMAMMPYNGGGGYHGVGDIKGYLDEQRKIWELEQKVKDLENAQVQVGGFIERQAEKLLEHPDLDPNVVVMSIGGVLSKAVNILEIAFGVNGAVQGATSPAAAQYTPRTKPPVNGTQPNPENIDGTSQEGGNPDDIETDDDAYDGEALTEVCEDLEVMFPNHRPEEILLKMKEMLKSDKMIQGIVKKKLNL
jgi:hypothetical protein